MSPTNTETNETIFTQSKACRKIEEQQLQQTFVLFPGPAQGCAAS